eukprot:1237457-Rhodomonas_salina.2
MADLSTTRRICKFLQAYRHQYRTWHRERVGQYPARCKSSPISAGHRARAPCSTIQRLSTNNLVGTP